MKIIVNNIKNIFKTKAVKNVQHHCNYANNYFGDQICSASLRKGDAV
ncbi:hypothetical protein [uncultured Paraglaciecola sp.]